MALITNIMGAGEKNLPHRYIEIENKLKKKKFHIAYV